MNVTDLTKEAFANTSSHKVLKIYFPNLDYTLDITQVYQESMALEESLIESGNIEFVGCIASEFEIKVHGVSIDIKGQQIEVSITSDDTEEIPLFKGIVDSAKKQTNKNYKKIVAYDELYTKGETELATWYNSLTFPISIREFRNSLFTYIGLEQEEKTLPNDDVTINKEYAPTTLRAISVIKAICQINGAFGIVNRYGKFEYRILTDLTAKQGAFPGATLYPPFYPGVMGSSSSAKDIAYYKKVDYEEYSVKPVEKVTIRQTDSESGVTYGEGTNNYIIQGNFFTLNKGADELLDIAQNIHGSIAGVEFVPFTAENSGYPFIEVGLDTVSYYAYDFEASATSEEDIYTQKLFYVFKRTLSGIQALKDVYSVQGEEYQKEFITDVSTQVEQIKQNLSVAVKNQIDVTLPQYSYSKEEINSMILKVLSVEVVPETWQPNTIYLIRGEVTVE